LDIIIVIDAHIEGKVMQGNVSCRFDGFCFCPHIYCSAFVLIYTVDSCLR